MVPGIATGKRLQVTLSARQRDAAIVAAAGLAQVAYLLAAWFGVRSLGYPLDDAWIYQGYARSLARAGQWAFIPGAPSTGSTSLLWALIVAPGGLLPGGGWLWTQLVGWASLSAAGLAAARLVDARSGSELHAVRPWLPLAAGLAVVLEWHLVWAAASGMETAFFAAAVLWFWAWFRANNPADAGYSWRKGLLLGLWGGGLMLARPEGVLTAAVAGLAGLAARGSMRRRVTWAAAALAGLALVVGPFLAFNVAVSGAPLPNTFYAKQTEYALLWAQPFLRRFAAQAGVTLVGAQILLIPGLLWEAGNLAGRRAFARLAPLVWVLLHWAMYAARLPVTYQHGRYAIPTIPIVMIYGIEGMIALAKPASRRMIVRVISRAWVLATAGVLVAATFVLGAPAYARDVAFIQREMVATAKWVARNVPEDATIAVHDIGAVGYFAPRPLLDLAGLVSPDVVPFMHDPTQLEQYILDSGGDYLIVFPRWNDAYAALVSSPTFEAVWSADEQPGYSSDSGLGPMTVYLVTGAGEGQ